MAFHDQWSLQWKGEMNLDFAGVFIGPQNEANFEAVFRQCQ